MEQRKFFFEMKELISRKHVPKLREKMYSTSPPIVPYLCTASLSLNVFFFLSLIHSHSYSHIDGDLLFWFSAVMVEEIAEIEEKNPQDMVSDKLINFQKRHLIGEVLCKLQRYQNTQHVHSHTHTEMNE
jgi:hypothetical protein